MITIYQSPTANLRPADFARVSLETLLTSSQQHISDVRRALALFEQLLHDAGVAHDHDKIADIEEFHHGFTSGLSRSPWWSAHRRLNRHHLSDPDGVPDDVNLIDVLDYIADCVMAGMARNGTVYALTLPPALLQRAFDHTVALLRARVRVVPLPRP